MQDRHRHLDEVSCDARPDHTLGHERRFKRASATPALPPGSRHSLALHQVTQWADIVAKVFLHDQSRNLLAVGATFE
jgi:hypothetical protein